MSSDDILSILTQRSKSEVLEPGEIPMPPLTKKVERLSDKSILSFSKMKKKFEDIFNKVYSDRKPEYMENKRLILKFIDMYFFDYIQTILSKIRSIIGNEGLFCSFFIMNAMVFYHELKNSYSSRLDIYFDRYIRDQIDIFMKKENGYGKTGNGNITILLDYYLKTKDFPIFSTVFNHTYFSLYIDVKGKRYQDMLKRRSPSPVRRRERSPIAYRERSDPIRERSWSRDNRYREESKRSRSRSRGRRRERDYDSHRPQVKKDDSKIIELLMEQNEKLMKIVSQGKTPLEPVSFHPHPLQYHPTPMYQYQYPPPPPYQGDIYPNHQSMFHR